jgi:DivIVA domain-containing protein
MVAPLRCAPYRGAVRRAAVIVAWVAMVGVVVSVSGYMGLLVHRKVNPPVVAADRENILPGWSTGDVGFLRKVEPHDIEVGDVLGVRIDGWSLGKVTSIQDAGPQAVTLRLDGIAAGGFSLTDSGHVIGRVDRHLPLLGWSMLAMQQRPVQLLLGAFVLAVAALLATGRRTPLDMLEQREPIPLGAAAPLALPAGPAVHRSPEVVMPYVERPMSITPEDLRQVRFAQTRKGYDTDAVDRALDTVADSLESLLQERQALVERLRVAESEVDRYKAMEGQLGHAVAEAERLRAEAQHVPAATDGTMIELLGEARAIRSLLQSLVARGD